MNIYQNNIGKYRERASAFSKEMKELSMGRLVAFLFSAFLLILLARTGLIVVVLMFVGRCGRCITNYTTGVCFFIGCAPGMRIWYLRYYIIPGGAGGGRAEVHR